MSYKKNTIATVIADIEKKKIFLPALQRKFVWGRYQIELLFDSLMRNYPFGTFLLWKLDRKKADAYVFYEFLTNYDERDPYNKRKTGAFSHEEIIGVLDGQQRLSSMFIGLMGTHTEKAPYKRRANQSAYETMSLYLNLLSLPYTITTDNRIEEQEDRNFEFRFLKGDVSKSNTLRRVTDIDGHFLREEPMLWMKVGDVLKWYEDPEFDQIIEELSYERTDLQKKALVDQKRVIKRALETLHRRLHRDELINYFEVAKDDLEDILKIFVRVNSGGTVLSKTDLLFSTIVATWDNGRERIEALLKKINAKGDKFSFGNEFLMRCCLVLTDAPVVYKVHSFQAQNVQKIRDEWSGIAKAVEAMVDLLVEFGFSGELLTSQNATIIIAYYLYKGGARNDESKLALRNYLLHALLNGIFGSSQDQLISSLRNAFRDEVKVDGVSIGYKGRFANLTFEQLLKIELPQQKTLKVTEADLDRFLAHTKGPSSFFVLTLLYPELRYSDTAFHQDHMHPYSGFTNENLTEMGIPSDQWPQWYSLRDCVPNLQLLNERRNISKNDTDLSSWLSKMKEYEREAFVQNNFFPSNVGLEFKEFIAFFAARRELLKEELKKVLAMNNVLQQPTPPAPSKSVPMWVQHEGDEEDSNLEEVSEN
jgi:hypothetical protein